jgi:energy-coupling factor transporter ATP-binding protein EcfA2
MDKFDESFQLDEFYLDLQNNGQNIFRLPDSDIKKNPFPGLRPFKTSEFPLFEGRNSQVQDILDRLKQKNFLAIIGSSGTGKSSLIRAGLLPQLYGGFLYEAGTEWNIAICRPGDAPLHNLSVSLSSAKCKSKLKEEIQQEYPAIYNMLIDSTYGLLGVNNLLKGDTSEKNLLVIIDQFEEVFRYDQKRTTLDNAEGHFINLLLNATTNKENRVFVIITMRSEFLGNTVRYRRLPEAINAGQYLVPQLSSEQLRKVIEAPIRRAEKSVQPELVELLINEIEQKLTTSENVDYLPVLQHALMQTYKHVLEKGSHLIMVQDYLDIGRMDESLSRHAEEVYNTLGEHSDIINGNGKDGAKTPNPSKKQNIAKMMFQALTDSRSDFKGGRRLTEVSVLHYIAKADIINANPTEVDAIIEVFRDEKVSFVIPSPITPLRPDLKLDISHESLMRNWPRLISWIEEEVEYGKLYKILNERRELYENDKDELLSGKALTGIVEWRTNYLNNAAWAERYHTGNQQGNGNNVGNSIIFNKNIAFLEKSLSVETAKLRQTKIRSGVIVSAITAAVLLLLFAYTQRERKMVGFALAALASVEIHKNDTLALLTALTAHEDILENGSDRDSAGLKTAMSKTLKLYQLRNIGALVIEKKNYKIVNAYIFKNDSRILVYFQRSQELTNAPADFTGYVGTKMSDVSNLSGIGDNARSILYYHEKGKLVQKEWAYPACYVENSDLVAVCKPSSISFYRDTMLTKQIKLETDLNLKFPVTSIKCFYEENDHTKPKAILVSRGAQDVTYYDLIDHKEIYFNINRAQQKKSVMMDTGDDINAEFLADGNILVVKDAIPKGVVDVTKRTIQIFTNTGRKLSDSISFNKDFSNVAFNLSLSKKLFILNLPDKTLLYDGQGLKDFNDTLGSDMDLKLDSDGNFLLHDKHKIHIFNHKGERIFPNDAVGSIRANDSGETFFDLDTIDRVFDFNKFVVLLRVKRRGASAATLIHVNLDPNKNIFTKNTIEQVPADLISATLSNDKKYFIGCQEVKTAGLSNFSSGYLCFNYSLEKHILYSKLQTNNSAIFLSDQCNNTISRESRTKYSLYKSQDKLVIFDIQNPDVHFSDNFNEIKRKYLPIVKYRPYADSIKVIFYKKQFLEVI